MRMDFLKLQNVLTAITPFLLANLICISEDARGTKMPKAGFKSITVSESVYDKFHDVFLKSKDDLAMKGVNSFSGYVTYMLEKMMQKDKTLARYAPKIEKISVDDDRIILKDNIKNRIAEITIRKHELHCCLCDKKDCVHVDFVFSLPDVYEILNGKKILRVNHG